MIFKKKLIHFSCKKYVWKGIFLTNNALLQINKIIKINFTVNSIRLILKQTGCFGFKYKIELVQNFFNDDLIFQNNNIIIYIKRTDIVFIDGTIIDFIKENFKEYFKYYNNNIIKSCGCGESFNIK
ncbi:iron-sulfur cluster assembly accessory protein [Enterobacteriaceae endosymbiont of Plateumaris sericea]|uniref:iron-sulfur cluster assembly accessory protein n=1 Tax=Enterobacteriaceae endosymbiont of Plateumaris sericea TaxID=2675797 RepID=UPI001448E037|nr:iron-sulfur cluster assembly accessory protein [Enterobacteriaceae endosymbiont of Plateumaris sericea]QJC30089.1 iron-sulfur cluster assembly accessory protein [Enterobacteriaceae endosymbiont of Plateumaris sericea]